MKSTQGSRATSGRLTRAAAYATVIGTLLAAATLAITLGTSAHGHGELRPAILQPVSLAVQQVKDKPIVEVILHNLGGERAIVTEVQTHILAEGQLTQCASQGELNLSQNYSVLLPARAQAGQVIATPIHEQLAGDEADRFSLSFSTVGEASVKEFKLPQRVYVYELGISLLHDAQRTPVRLGKIVVAVPSMPRVNEYFLTAEDATPAFRDHMMAIFGSHFYAEHGPCYRKNALALKRVLALPGVRDPALTAATSQLVVSP